MDENGRKRDLIKKHRKSWRRLMLLQQKSLLIASHPSSLRTGGLLEARYYVFHSQAKVNQCSEFKRALIASGKNTLLRGNT